MFNDMRSSTWSARILYDLVRDPGEPQSLLWAFAVNSVAGSYLVPGRLRTILFRTLGINISLNALVKPQVIIRSPKLTIGPGSTVNYRCIFDNREGVEIGKSVGIGIGVQFVNTDHNTDDPIRRAGFGESAKVIVEDGAYIGSGVILLPGVTVRSGAVVAAGAVVSRDCEADGVYAGIPARRIKDLPVAA